MGDREAIVGIVIPCLEEEQAIVPLVAGLRPCGVDEIVVVDGGCVGRGAEVARDAGA